MRIHGRAGIAYLSVNNGDAASPVAFLSEWTVDYKQNVFDITVITDVQVVHAAGLPEASGTFTGFYDSATAQSYAAAVDGLPRNLYIYPSSALPGTFFAGMVLPDYSIAGGSTNAVKLTVTWASATAVAETSTTPGIAFAGLATGTGTALSPAPALVPALAVFPSVPGAAVPGLFTPGQPYGPGVYGATYQATY